LAGQQVELLEHDPAWTEAYRSERTLLLRLLGPAALDIRHIGSTAVPGLVAKPIIDILVVARSLDELEARRTSVEEAGFRWKGEHGVPGRRYLSRDAPGWPMERSHVHMFAADHPEVERHLRFRDALRASPETAAAYAALKRELHARFPHDRTAYTDGKSEFIAAVLRADSDVP
jgi:GrpB-like predicted nucleotidyltransferase (UPF0157 family)